jgi:hypothetical protein
MPARAATDELEHVGARGQRCAGRTLHRRDRSVRAADDEAGDATDATRERFDDAHHEGRRDRRVDGVTAFAQHLDARLRRELMLRGDHATASDRLCLAVIPLAAGVGHARGY